MSKDVTKTNREFYESLYSGTPSWLSALRAFTSFDQQSKAKPNYRVARELLMPAAASGEKLRILDYGAGWGTFLLKWPKKIASCWCYDISRASVQQCVRAGGLVGREISAWSGEGEPFDLICCSHVLEHVPDDLALLNCLRSNTRPGGMVLLNVPINEVWEDPKHVRRYDRASLRAVVEAAGLSVVVEREGDRISTLLAKGERATASAPLSKIAWRGLRLILALVPNGLLCRVDRLLESKHAPSQLITAARNSL